MPNRLGSYSQSGSTVYMWNWIWPSGGQLILGGFHTRLLKARIVGGGELSFQQEPHRITLSQLPDKSPDAAMGVAVIALTFEEPPICYRASFYPALHGGRIWPGAAL